MPDPLTLNCFCEGDATVSGCEILDIIFHAYGLAQNHGFDLSSQVSLHSDWPSQPPAVIFPITGAGAQTCSVSLGTGIIPYWDTMYVEFAAAASVLQILTGGLFANVDASWKIEIVYQCVDPDTEGLVTRSVFAYPRQSAGDVCTLASVDRVIVKGGPMGGYGLLYSSSPLAECNGATIHVGLFAPSPEDVAIDINLSGDAVCLCAQGGTPPYYYRITEGRLPEGKTLDSSTGCMTGTATGPGTDTVKFEVIDSAGNVDDVECNLVAPCDCDDREAVGGNSFY